MQEESRQQSSNLRRGPGGGGSLFVGGAAKDGRQELRAPRSCPWTMVGFTTRRPVRRRATAIRRVFPGGEPASLTVTPAVAEPVAVGGELVLTAEVRDPGERMIADAALTGGMPPALGDLESLVRLGLNRNDLTGAIPPKLGDVASLRRGRHGVWPREGIGGTREAETTRRTEQVGLPQGGFG